MPQIEFLQDNSNLDSDEKEYYLFEPSQFELFPKVNKLIRRTYCNLGLWNLDAMYPDVTQLNDASDNWALGQVFVRENGLNIEWAKDGDDYVAVVSFEKAVDTTSVMFAVIVCIIVMILLILYVWSLTRLKFRRIKEQNEQFKKIKILTSNFELEVDPEFSEVFRA